ncbi:tax1-binding protein 1 homolog B [Patella vulgata]|uniref:tax1-binding protein 1 homolog B n=1 Tax=Patella vulgata TaxID=6465 RepID=UPI0024A7C024|nr:tax1-binding protein 1 homolog B [Patella vulgata]
MENNNSEAVDTSDAAVGASNSKMQRSAYAAVIFLNVAEMYPADAHVECKYTLTNDIIPSTRDWIGLYKVGWMSANDYYYYEWAPSPKDYKPQTEAQAEILFQAHNLPDDDGEFYQFCYVASSGQIRGASTPFQFKRPSANDFVEIHDIENDMMIVKEKKSYLEENLKEASLQKAALIQEKQEINEELKDLKNSLKALEKQLNYQKSLNKKLTTQLSEKCEELEVNNHNTHELIQLNQQLDSNIMELTQEKATVDKKIDLLTTEIVAVKDRMKVLQNEKDELEGQNKLLKEETDMVKSHLTLSEGKASNLAREITVMQKKLEEKECYIAACQMEIATLKSALHQQTVKTEQQHNVMASNVDTVEKLQEKLRNTEDKLEAAVKIKEIMSNEMGAYSIANDDLKKELDTCHGENLELKKDVERMETEFAKEAVLLRTENESMQADLKKVVTEKEELQKEMIILQEEKKTNSTTASMYALQLANNSLTERHKLMEVELEKKEAKAKRLQKETTSLENELRREIEDLKERITMCSDAYKQLYKENIKLQKKCKHCRSRITGDKTERSAIEPEQLQKASSVSSAESVTYIMTSQYNTDNENKSSSPDADSNAGADIKAKMVKFKKMYHAEHFTNECLRREHLEEMKKKDSEIHTLKSTMRSRTTELEHKHMSCTSFLAEKDKQIEELNHTIRDLKMENSSLRMSDNGSVNDMKYMAQPCQFVYGNPYLQQRETFRSSKDGPKNHLPPLIYPHIPVRQTQPCFVPPTTPDPLSESESTDGLPAPISPTVLPSAKAAAVRAACFSNIDDQTDMNFVDARNYFDKTVPSAPFDLDEDKFVDAKGVGMKICPGCNMSFSPDISDADFEEHVLTHSGRICPVCNHLADENTTDNDFNYHVNGCIDKENN